MASRMDSLQGDGKLSFQVCACAASTNLTRHKSSAKLYNINEAKVKSRAEMR